MDTKMQACLEADRQLVETKLNSCFTGNLPQKRLFEAMRYSLLAGGKRIRPILTLAFCRACGGSAEDALPFACGVEMLHTYSLIHDDLPCMDNSDLRRGRPTNHVIFGEYTAVLAGDALQAAAFEAVLEAELPAEWVVKAAGALALAAGELGICGGQILDLDGQNADLGLAEIETLHRMKTAALIEAAVKMGCIAAGAPELQCEAAGRYARALGLAFQLQDDILDVESSAGKLGKPVGADGEKSTFLRHLGVSRCRELVQEKSEEAKRELISHFQEPEFLLWLTDLLSKREN